MVFQTRHDVSEDEWNARLSQIHYERQRSKQIVKYIIAVNLEPHAIIT
jgi:hypothetical protein